MTLIRQQEILAEQCQNHNVRFNELPSVKSEIAKAIQIDFYAAIDSEANFEEMQRRHRTTGSTFYDNAMRSGRRVWNNARHPVQTEHYNA